MSVRDSPCHCTNMVDAMMANVWTDDERELHIDFYLRLGYRENARRARKEGKR
jgi:hypothetical protein